MPVMCFSMLILFIPFFTKIERLSFFIIIPRLVSWCSWLSHHFHVVRVPGSNPGGTIFAVSSFFPFLLPLDCPPFKKAAEGSFDQPTCKLWACRATTAPPRFPLSFSFSSICASAMCILFKKLHHRESNPGHKRERLVCYQLHHNGYLYYMFLPLSYLYFFFFYYILFFLPILLRGFMV